MKLLNLFKKSSQFFKTEKRIDAWLRSYNIENYTINPDLTVIVRDNVNLNQCDHIPVKFSLVKGDFIAYKTNTFENFPTRMNGRLYVGNNIKSFHNIHKIIRRIGQGIVFGSITDTVVSSQLTRVINIPTHILGLCFIEMEHNYIDSKSPIVDNLFLDHKHNMLLFQQGLLDAGFIEQAKI